MDSETAVARSVLLIEDNSSLRSGLVDILRLEGYKVTAVKTSLQGLQVLAEADPSPSVIVTDVRLDDISKDPFITAVRAKKRWRRIPFVFLTSSKPTEAEAKRSGVGHEVFLKKPFEIRDLLTTIEQFLSSTRPG